MTDLSDLVEIANAAYNTDNPPTGEATHGTFHHQTNNFLNDTISGLQAHSFFSTSQNTLVIGFGGTNVQTEADLLADLELVFTDTNRQVDPAVAYARSEISRLQSLHGTQFDVVITGHSLGGYVSQAVELELSQDTHLGTHDISATVFNSPGIGGAFGTGTTPQNRPVTYVYSNPMEWYHVEFVVPLTFGEVFLRTGDIHAVGELVSNDILFVLEAAEHELTTPNPENQGLLESFRSNAVPLTRDELVALWKTQLESGELSPGLLIHAATEPRPDSFVIDMAYQALREANKECFSAGTLIEMADGSQKPIEEITPGDWVLSYDKAGTLVPGRVENTSKRRVKNILDVFGLMVTPGHVTLCGDGQFAGQHVPIIDILRSDGSLVRKDGSQVRAATGCDVGSCEDRFVLAVTGDVLPDGQIKVREAKKIRAGTRILLEDGRDISVSAIISANGAEVSENGLVISKANAEGVPFHWSFSDHLPNPEAYVLAKSEVGISEIYDAAEWEDMRPVLPRNVRSEEPEDHSEGFSFRHNRSWKN